MKFVYVLISNETDYLGEKTIISLFSLRNHHDCNVEIFTDQSTVNSIPQTIERLRNLGADIKIEQIPDGLNQIQKSRYLKTSLRERVKGDFIFLDLDTVITGDLSELESIECDLAMALQHDCLDYNHKASWQRVKEYNTLRRAKKKERYGIKYFFNSGVIVYRDSPLCHKICKLWHNAWYESSSKFGWEFDQTDLDRINASMNNVITVLEGKFNCQLTGFRYALSHLSDAKVIHYFNYPNRLSYLEIKQPEYLEKIRRTDDFSMMQDTINRIKRDYVNGLHIMEQTTYENLLHRIFKLESLISRNNNPIKYPISKFINKFPFLRRQVDLIKSKLT